MASLSVGAAAVDITPRTSQFLYGYPHVPRHSTGVHDPLLSSALYLRSGGSLPADGHAEILFVASDVIFIPRDLATRARQRIADATSLAPEAILLSATHTHSGPVTCNYLSNEADPVVPKADPDYLAQLEAGIVEAGIAAWRSAAPAEIGFASFETSGLGTNRRDPEGPSDPAVPVLVLRSASGHAPVACMLVCAMHPTVLHEDSCVVSGDFPGLARQYLQRHVFTPECPIVYHMGASGNQSPRHVTRANTLKEAARLGEILGRGVEQAIIGLEFHHDIDIEARATRAALVPARFPSLREAEQKLEAQRARLEQLRSAQAPRQEIRTAECDWFGAEETVTLSRAAEDGRLAAVQESVSPAEIQVIRVGPWTFAGWPGEVFVEYALALRAAAPDTYLITLANGDLQGYIVTPEAEREGGYEASNAVFAAESGAILLRETLSLIHQRTQEPVTMGRT